MPYLVHFVTEEGDVLTAEKLQNVTAIHTHLTHHKITVPT